MVFLSGHWSHSLAGYARYAKQTTRRERGRGENEMRERERGGIEREGGREGGVGSIGGGGVKEGARTMAKSVFLLDIKLQTVFEAGYTACLSVQLAASESTRF